MPNAGYEIHREEWSSYPILPYDIARRKKKKKKKIEAEIPK
jgi:hypothetical protein